MDKLLERAKNGDEYAMEEILAQRKQLVNSVVRKYFLIGGDTEDLIQEGVYALFKAVRAYDKTKNSSFDAYAYMVIERRIISIIKSANSKKNLPLNEAVKVNNQGTISTDDNDDGVGYMISSADPDPENELLDNDSYNELMAKIKETLSVYENKVLELYLEGYNYNDIALKLDVLSKSVDNALNRIKNKLEFLRVKE